MDSTKPIQKWWILISVACGTFMATLDSSIVNITLPTLTKEFAVSLQQVRWTVLIYLLVLTCLLLPFGQLSDQKGRKIIFQCGFIIFILGSLFCGFSHILSTLIFFRALQGIGAAMMMANGPAIITKSFTNYDRGGALGALAMVVSLGLVTGPSIGAYLITHFGWRSIFFINVPIGLIGLLLVQYHLPFDTPFEASTHPFDWTGTFLQTGVILLITQLLDPPRIILMHHHLATPFRWSACTLIIILCILFLQVEASKKYPLFDLNLLRIETFWKSNLAGFLVFVAFSAVTVLMPFFLEEIVGFSIRQAGFFMSIIPITIFVIAPISGFLSDRLGSRELCLSGACIGMGTLFALAGIAGPGLHATSSSLWIGLGCGMIGLGNGLFSSPNNNAIMSSVPSHKLGIASALLATIRNLGLMTGTSLSTTLFSLRLNVTHNFTHAFHMSLLMAGFVYTAVVLLLLKKPKSQLKIP